MVSGAQGNYLIRPTGTDPDGGGGAIVVNIGHGREEVAEVAARGLREVTRRYRRLPPKRASALSSASAAGWPPGLTRVGFTSGARSP
jgi:adenosylmethionine-8-amino-7-oxononanoate aminotransferase